MSYFITPRVRSLYFHYSNDPSIRDAFDKSHVKCISDTLNIIRSVFKPQFIHFTKYAKYAFLLLFSIYTVSSYEFVLFVFFIQNIWSNTSFWGKWTIPGFYQDSETENLRFKANVPHDHQVRISQK